MNAMCVLLPRTTDACESLRTAIFSTTAGSGAAASAVSRSVTLGAGALSVGAAAVSLRIGAAGG